MRTLYMVKYGCGQWEDYHEDIEYMFETFEEAKQKCLQLQHETDARLQRNERMYKALNKLDEEDIEGIYTKIVGKTTYCVAFFEFIESPKEYPEILKLFDEEMQQKLLQYAELEEATNSISIFDNDFDNPHYFMSVYEWSDNGQMNYTKMITSETLEKM